MDFNLNLARNPVRSKHFTSSGGQVGHIAWGFSGSPGFSTCFFHSKPSLTPSCGGFSLSHGVQSLSRTRLLLPDSEHFCLNWCFILMQSLPRQNAHTDTHAHTHSTCALFENLLRQACTKTHHWAGPIVSKGRNGLHLLQNKAKRSWRRVKLRNIRELYICNERADMSCTSSKMNHGIRPFGCGANGY